MKKIITIIIIMLMMLLPIVHSQELTINNINTTVDDNSALINWTSNIAGSSKVIYGIENINIEKSDSNSNTNHSIKIDNLQPDTTYQYKVQTSTADKITNSTIQSFKTNPEIKIENIVSDVTIDTAVINFTTNVDIDAYIEYGNLTKELKSLGSNNKKEHSITITGLVEDTEYLAQVVTEYKTSTEFGFKTKVASENFLDVEVPEYYNSQYIDLSGKFSEDGKVILRVNQGRSGTRFKEGSSFNFNRVLLIPNEVNELLFEVTDGTGFTKEYIYNINVDVAKPILTITKEPPVQVKDQNIVSIAGNVNENVSLSFEISTEQTTQKIKQLPAPTVRSEKAGLVQLQWNVSDNPNKMLYKVYKNGVLFTVTDDTSITDHSVGSNNIYKYQVSVLDRECNEGEISNELVYVTPDGTIQDSTRDKYEYECKPNLKFEPISVSGAWSKELPIDEGVNYIIITAKDLAGNTVKEYFNVTKDTKPPEIKNISPSEATGSGYFLYEGTLGTRLTISGETDPGALVELKVEGNSVAKTDADENGYFEFKKVNIESLADSKISDAYLPSEQNDLGPDKALEREEQINVDATLIATDKTGLQSQEESLRFTIGTCWSGQLKFDIMPLSAYQSPATLNPDRIEEGNEVINFYLSTNYTGEYSDWDIESIAITPRCEATAFAKDKKYNISCKLLPHKAIIKPNPTKDIWFVSIKLNKMDDLSKNVGLTTKEFLKAMQGEIRFPFNVIVKYRENKTSSFAQTQRKCMEVSYLLDNSRIDPRKVMPDWLLDGSLDLTNSTLQILEKIIPQVKQALKITAVATFAGFLAKVGTKAARKFQCQTEAITNPSCPAQGSTGRTSFVELDATQIKEQGLKQGDLMDSELLGVCPQCYAAWEQESKMQQLLRWTGDRFLCHKTPAKWTEDKDSIEIQDKIKSATQCLNKESIQKTGLILPKVNNAPSGRSNNNPKGYNVYWVFDGAQYVKNNETIKNNKITLIRAYGGGEIGSKIPDKLDVTWLNGQAFLDYNDVPDYYKKSAKWTANQTSVNITIAKSICESKDSPFKRKAEVDSDYSYREDISKITCYNENRYYEGRDQSACFGQDNLIYKEKMPMLTPQDHTSSFQCLCVSGIYNRLRLLRNIMLNLNNCFLQIKTTGDASAGTCKQVFTMYMCDTLWQLISYFTEDCAPLDINKAGVTGGDFAKRAIQSGFSSVEESVSELNQDYSNSILEGYVGGGTQGIMRKVCLGSLTGDWGIDFESIADASYTNNMKTVVQAWQPTREFLTSTPYNDKARYEYKLAWNIMPGCNVDSYTVSLSCINEQTALEYGSTRGLDCSKVLTPGEDHPYGGCDCWKLDQSKEEPFYTGSAQLKQSSFEDRSHSRIIESTRRYDHIKLKVNIRDSKSRETCLPEGHKDGVWYFPIEDKTVTDLLACSLNPLQGTFSCTPTEDFWYTKGHAYFVDDPKEPQGTPGRTYHPGDEILYDVNIFNRNEDKPQCLEIEVQNDKGARLVQHEPIYIEIDHNNTKEYSGKVLDQISFSTESVSFESEYQRLITIQYAGRKNEKNVAFKVGFRDENKDGKITTDGKDKYIIYGTDTAVPQDIDSEYLNIKDVNMKIISIYMPTSGNEILSHEINVTVTAESIKADNQVQDWIVHMELRNKADKSDFCKDTTSANVIRSEDFKTQVDVKIRIEPESMSTQVKDACPTNMNIFSSSTPCICGDGVEKNCGTTTEGQFCYAVGSQTGTRSCQQVKQCFLNDNSEFCSCEKKLLEKKAVGFVDGLVDTKYCCANSGNLIAQNTPCNRNLVNVDSKLGVINEIRLKEAYEEYYNKVYENQIQILNKNNIDYIKGLTTFKNRLNSKYPSELIDTTLNKKYSDYTKKELIEQIAKLSDYPPELIAILWYRESSLRENTYLHNGETLGKHTTITPKNILFNSNEFVTSSINALSTDKFKSYKKQLNITYNTTNIAKIAAFAETFNGFGYRDRHWPNAYILAGTQHYDKGYYIADGVFQSYSIAESPGVIPLIYAYRNQEEKYIKS